ncbi:MAG: hypothetical protein JOZ72_13045 [Alphaproteobacteria bacterium]|nr:hypothetical protein [Alphaproteobacteria bacterium]
MKIVLHIDRVVLDGLAVAGTDGPRLRRALARELTRLLADGGVAQGLSAGTVLPHIQAPRLSYAKREKPDALGAKIAQAVHAGIGKPR